VRKDGEAGFSLLKPRQRLTPAPTAMVASMSLTNTGLLDASRLTGRVLDARLSKNVALLTATQTFSGLNLFTNLNNSFTGNGSGVTDLDANNLTTGTVAAARLPSQVSLLGQSIGSTEIADGSIVNADINATAAIADTKLARITAAGKVANSATTATSASSVNTIVARDAAGDFSAGTITASSFGLATPQTRSLSLLGAAFQPLSSSMSYVKGLSALGGVHGTEAGQDVNFVAQMQLPHGARVNALRMRALDDDTTENIRLSIYYYSDTTVGNVMECTSSGSSASVRTFSDTGGFTVDNESYAYLLIARWTVPAASDNIRFVQAYVDYEISSVLP
jgi:hypothetical protein